MVDIARKVLVLPGDGIGPEVTEQALRVLRAVESGLRQKWELEEGLIGGCALDAEGVPLPDATLEQAGACDAVFLGAVGGPQWDGVEPRLRPESGLLALRSGMGLFANLRPAVALPVGSSPLRPERLRGMDLLVVRELGGGLYFGQPRGSGEEGGQRAAHNTMRYTEEEIRRVADVAFDLAAGRRGEVVSVDKANVLEVSQLWREVVQEQARARPNVRLRHMYVDNAAMQMVLDPCQFDVILTGNLFGDVLSDLAGGIVGSLGVLPSASFGQHMGMARALYEPCHGSAPDIAGTGKANPLGAILSVAMMLRHSLMCPQGADAVEAAVTATLRDGVCTQDLLGPDGAGGQAADTAAVADAVLQRLQAQEGLGQGGSHAG